MKINVYVVRRFAYAIPPDIQINRVYVGSQMPLEVVRA